MGQIALLRSMLILVEHRMALGDPAERGDGGIAASNLAEALEPDSPEAILLYHIESLSAAELSAFRQQICLGALKTIDKHFAGFEAQ